MNRVQPDTTLPKTPEIILYSSKINQLGTAIPTEIILHNPNDITIVWIRSAAGIYEGTIQNWYTMTQFDLDTCATIIIPNSTPGKQTNVRGSMSTILVLTSDYAGGYADGGLSSAGLELRIFTDKAKFY